MSPFANGSSSITVPLKARPVRMDSVDLSRNVKSSSFESSSCTGVTVNRKKSLSGKNYVLVQGSGGVVHRGNGGGRTATDTFGFDGDLAQRVDRLLARGRLTVGILPGGTGRKAPDSDGYAKKRVFRIPVCCRTLVDRANGGREAIRGCANAGAASIAHSAAVAAMVNRHRFRMNIGRAPYKQNGERACQNPFAERPPGDSPGK